MPITARQLKRAEERAQLARRRVEEADAARDQLIRQALAEGWTGRRIAETLNLSPGRISQIAGHERKS